MKIIVDTIMKDIIRKDIMHKDIIRKDIIIRVIVIKTTRVEIHNRHGVLVGINSSNRQDIILKWRPGMGDRWIIHNRYMIGHGFIKSK